MIAISDAYQFKKKRFDSSRAECFQITLFTICRYVHANEHTRAGTHAPPLMIIYIYKCKWNFLFCLFLSSYKIDRQCYYFVSIAKMEFMSCWCAYTLGWAYRFFNRGPWVNILWDKVVDVKDFGAEELIFGICFPKKTHRVAPVQNFGILQKKVKMIGCGGVSQKIYSQYSFLSCPLLQNHVRWHFIYG